MTGGGTVDAEDSLYPVTLHASPLRGLLGRGFGSDPDFWMRPAPRDRSCGGGTGEQVAVAGPFAL